MATSPSARILTTALIPCVLGIFNLQCTTSAIIQKTHAPTSIHPNEIYFKTLTGLTEGGSTVAAHWSNDGAWLTFQHSGPGLLKNDAPLCNQIYRVRSNSTELLRLTYQMGSNASPSFFP